MKKIMVCGFFVIFISCMCLSNNMVNAQYGVDDCL